MILRPPEATVDLYTSKDGLLARVGHDLHLRVARFQVSLDEYGVRATFDARSIAVVTAMKDGVPSPGLSADDRRQIDANVAEHVLAVKRYPEIRFEADAWEDDGDTWQTDGRLTLAGRTRDFTVQAGVEGDRRVLRARIHQPDFGIAPFTALLGTLRILPDVQVVVSWPA